MRRINLILLTMLALLLVHVASAASEFLVTDTAPVYPGDTTYIYVPVQNLGFGNFLTDVTVRLVPKDNASANAVSLLDDIAYLGTIDKWGDQRTARFRIHVNPDSKEGNYLFDVYITSTGQLTGAATQPTPVTTKLEDQILTIKGKPVLVLLNSTLGFVEPMSINSETLLLKNTGTGTVQNVVGELDVSGSSFSILGGGTKFSLGNLKPGDEASITFDLAVDIAARPGVYNLPLTFTGLDNFSSSDFVGLVVAGTTDFEISYQVTLGSFSLNVANVGINPASAVTVSIPNQKNFTSTGSSSAVLGNLNPGDYTSAIFQISKKPGAGNNLDVVIQYTDTSGVRHAITKNLAADLASTQAGTRAQSSTNYTTWLLAAVIIVVLYWQRRKITSYFRKPKGG